MKFKFKSNINIKLKKKMATENNLSLTICVYCGASSGAKDVYEEVARNCGQSLAKAGIRTVYGGGRVGLMGVVADSALDNGGEVVGIITSHIQDREPKHHTLTELQIVESMHDRKALMEKRSDAFLILPGGLGTMDEFFEILTWKTIGLHDKPIVFLNIDGYWNPLFALIDNIIDQGFAKKEDRDFMVVDTMEEAISFFETL